MTDLLRDEDFMLKLIPAGITAVVSLLNIIITVVLTYTNYRNLKKADKRQNMIEALTKYYLPIRVRLERIDLLFKIALDNNADFAIEKPSYKVADKSNKEAIIQAYDDFLLFKESTPAVFGDMGIDLKIINLERHMQSLVLASQKGLNLAILDKEILHNPDVKEIIKDINRIMEKNKFVPKKKHNWFTRRFERRE